MPTLDPVILFFLLGAFAGLARAELRLPAAIYDFVSTLLLLAIGLKGGRPAPERASSTPPFRPMASSSRVLTKS